MQKTQICLLSEKFCNISEVESNAAAQGLFLKEEKQLAGYCITFRRFLHCCVIYLTVATGLTRHFSYPTDF